MGGGGAKRFMSLDGGGGGQKRVQESDSQKFEQVIENTEYITSVTGWVSSY